jgi:hypothetical protein
VNSNSLSKPEEKSLKKEIHVNPQNTIQMKADFFLGCTG